MLVIRWYARCSSSGRTSAVGNVLAYYGAAVEPPNQSAMYPEITHPGTNGTIEAALGDFRRLGALDLRVNHPSLAAPADGDKHNL